jgi:hypothetical protein
MMTLFALRFSRFARYAPFPRVERAFQACIEDIFPAFAL